MLADINFAAILLLCLSKSFGMMRVTFTPPPTAFHHHHLSAWTQRLFTTTSGFQMFGLPSGALIDTLFWAMLRSGRASLVISLAVLHSITNNYPSHSISIPICGPSI